ncbi:hypothetical protein SAMN05216337_1017138 [Bradyrhizobium brasilense]|uniref:Uncharacterized protein n=1 Tax=Bradyrhizobium brasilense TaxID=1419277 RepID=A0A1G6Z040_9BRAD|nr:hypothetical protein [Bradyrhizobium brasilense]SDD95196.1 hypothetical protein SAMN05216337_1017138 [Bradyrhizobium brasilense]
MIVMKSMELDDEDKVDFCAPIECPKPDYPYGLRICLTEKEFAKLDLDPSCAAVGGMVHGHFMARITSVAAEDNSHGNTCRVELQIEDLAIESEDEENEEN